MKALFWIGLVVLVLSVVSLLVPIPETKAGDLSLRVETRHHEKPSPVISALLIAGGVGIRVFGTPAVAAACQPQGDRGHDRRDRDRGRGRDQQNRDR